MAQRIADVHVRNTVPLPTPRELEAELPMSDEVRASVVRGRQAIEDILDGRDSRLLIITGPCSIHDEQAALEYAERLARLNEELGDRVCIAMRVYFEKPRTTVGWKGMIYDPDLDGSFDIASGLRRARQLLLTIAGMGLPTATEFLDPITPAVPRRPHLVDGHRRPHDGEPDAPPDGERALDAGRLQEQHRGQHPDRRRRHAVLA